ncbi:MAG: hypothetical protein ACE5GC_07620 [Acidimicrobiia bacterium]
MRRILSTIGPAVLGATAGHVAHQLLHQQSDEEPQELVVAAPFANVVLAIVASKLLGGRRGFSAVVVGFGVSAAVGTALDDMVPSLADCCRDQLSAHTG